MRTRIMALAVAAIPFAATAAAAERTYDLTLEQALDLARRRAPALIAARAAADVARARSRAIYRWTRENPSLSVDAGPRFAEDGDRTTDIAAGIEQTFELGGRGAARADAAAAEIDRTDASAANATRRLLGEVAAAFVAAQHRAERLAIARDRERLGAERLRVAERREASGDAGALDSNLARVAFARARAATLAAEAAHLAALGELRVLLDLDPGAPLALGGDLRRHLSASLDDLLARAAERPDLKALEAEAERAAAEMRLAEGAKWPELGVRVGYEREEGADIALGGLSFTLPVIDRGQALAGAAAARRSAALARLEAARRAASDEVRTAFAGYELLVRAVGGLESDALPHLAENEKLARRSYELGRMPLGELLVAQREMIAARVTYVDLLRDAALAAVELELRSGSLS